MRLSAAIGFWMAMLGAWAFGDEGPAKPPEMEVFGRFIGTWDCEVISKLAVWTPKEVREKTMEVNEWVMDGWFMHGTGKSAKGEIRTVVMNTYDPAAKLYRFWQFLLGGRCSESIGKWDEATKTLTLTTGLDGGITMKGLFHIIDQNHRQYDIVAQDAEDKVYLNVHGEVSRRK